MVRFSKLVETWLPRLERAGVTQADYARWKGTTPQSVNLVFKYKSPTIKTVQSIETFLAENGEPFKMEYILDE